MRGYFDVGGDRLPRRVATVYAGNYRRLYRLIWQGAEHPETIGALEVGDEGRPVALRPGVYEALTKNNRTRFFEVHRDGGRALASVLWQGEDRGIARACCRSRAQLDRMAANQA